MLKALVLEGAPASCRGQIEARRDTGRETTGQDFVPVHIWSSKGRRAGTVIGGQKPGEACGVFSVESLAHTHLLGMEV